MMAKCIFTGEETDSQMVIESKNIFVTNEYKNLILTALNDSDVDKRYAAFYEIFNDQSNFDPKYNELFINLYNDIKNGIDNLKVTNSSQIENGSTQNIADIEEIKINITDDELKEELELEETITKDSQKKESNNKINENIPEAKKNVVSSFTPDTGEFIVKSILFALGSILSFGLAVPALVIWFMKWIFNYVTIDDKEVCFDGDIGEFYIQCIKWGLLFIITLSLYGFVMPIYMYRWVIERIHFKENIDNSNVVIENLANTSAELTEEEKKQWVKRVKLLTIVAAIGTFIGLICLSVSMSAAQDVEPYFIGYHTYYRVVNFDQYYNNMVAGYTFIVPSALLSIINIVLSFSKKLKDELKMHIGINIVCLIIFVIMIIAALIIL